LTDLVRDLASDLRVEDIKELSKTLTVIANEKLRTEKDTKAKKKSLTSKRPNLKADSGVEYQDYDLDADDFM
jgi:hypothetical protein